MKEKFIDHRFNNASLELVETANGILNEYRNMGYRLSLRQLYYQLVARDYIENSVKSYKRIGNLISEARLAGLLDWGMIEDRGRETVIPTAWESPAQIVRAAAQQFRIDRWEGQPCYVEVMVEKDALSGILEPVCRDLHVRFTANKGYSSSSAMYETGKRIVKMEDCVEEIHIFYLGDHDPSGIDMTRDIAERLELFTYGTINATKVHRLALNWNQAASSKHVSLNDFWYINEVVVVGGKLRHLFVTNRDTLRVTRMPRDIVVCERAQAFIKKINQPKQLSLFAVEKGR